MIYGQLLIRPWELDKMTFREVILALEGMREKDKLLQDIYRRMTFIIAASGFNAKAVVSKFDTKLWPGEKSSVGKIRERALATLKKLKEDEKQKNDLEKIKNILNGG